MKTCGSCKHWGAEGERGKFRRCTRIVHDHQDYTDDRTVYASDPTIDDEAKAMRQELAVVKDGSGMFATLCCREDFGCVLHEEKR